MTTDLKCSGMKVIKNDFLKVSLHFMHLAKNNATLPLDVSVSQNTVLNDVR